MTKREVDQWDTPLAVNRSKLAKQVLINLAAFVTNRKPDEVTPRNVSNFFERIRGPKCFRCWDSGFVGAGPMAPMTGMDCDCEAGQRKSPRMVMLP